MANTEKIVRPHQIAALVELADGVKDVAELTQKYGDEVVGMLSGWLGELLSSPDEKLILVDRSRSSICEANCRRRNTEPDQLCNVGNSQTIIAELQVLKSLNMLEAKVTGYSINELRKFVDNMTQSRSITDLL